jgi:hypothetical protein
VPGRRVGIRYGDAGEQRGEHAEHEMGGSIPLTTAAGRPVPGRDLVLVLGSSVTIADPGGAQLALFKPHAGPS